MTRSLPARVVARREPAQELSRAAFFDVVLAELRQLLPAKLGEPRVKRFGSLLKVFYTNERIHYEVALDSRLGQIEIGLHCEDGPMNTLTFLRFFNERIVELKHTLGPEVELERWTMSWGRLFELWPMTRLDTETAKAVGRRLAVMVRTLEPLLGEAGLSSR
ncbi:MAG: hypothetical protein C4346_03090 [Chloroflexota bacterium]